MFQFISFLIVLCFCAQNLLADDAMVLPEGRFRVRLVSTYTEIGNKYDGSGESQSLGSSFSRQLDGKLLTALTKKPELVNAVKQLNSMLPGSGDALMSENIATLNTDIDTQVFANQFVLEYGITPRLSVGIIVPVIHASVDVNASSTPDANFVKATASMNAADPRKALRSGMKENTSISAINQLLQNQFNYAGGMQSWSGTGLGDVDVGFKYNYFREHPIRATIKSGVRLPTGTDDDPNKLFDVAFGDHQFDLAAFHYIDYDLLSNLAFTWETGYTAQLPDTNDYRIPLSSELPIGTSTTRLNRKLGDYWETGLEANLSPIQRLILSAKYRYKQKFQDSYSSDDGVDASLLEQNTSETLHEGNFQAEYTNLSAVRAGTERVPYGFVVFYRLPFQGTNVSDARTTGIQLKTYF